MERLLVQVVHLTLDHLDQLEVPDDDFVDEGGEQVGRSQGAKPCFADQGVDEPLQRGQRAGMDGEHDVPCSHQVDLPADQAGRIRIVGLQSLQRQMQPVLGPRQLGAAVFIGESLEVRLGDPRRSASSPSASSSSRRSTSTHRSWRSPSSATVMSAGSSSRSCPSASNSRAVTGLS